MKYGVLGYLITKQGQVETKDFGSFSKKKHAILKVESEIQGLREIYTQINILRSPSNEVYSIILNQDTIYNFNIIKVKEEK